MADLTTSYTALGLGLTRAERREVVVEEETLVRLVEHVVHQFLIQLRAQRTGAEALRLSTGEDGRSVRHRKR